MILGLIIFFHLDVCIFTLMEFFHVSADTFAMHANLYKRGLLTLPIIIPESDLSHPVIDVELDPDCSQVEPDIPVSSHCSLTQQTVNASITDSIKFCL